MAAMGPCSRTRMSLNRWPWPMAPERSQLTAAWYCQWHGELGVLFLMFPSLTQRRLLMEAARHP